MKQEIILKCECGKEIKGFSEHHLKKNLETHKMFNEHNERLMLIKKHKNILYFKNLNKNKIVELLANNPIIINDLKEIGRNYEKKVMVS